MSEVSFPLRTAGAGVAFGLALVCGCSPARAQLSGPSTDVLPPEPPIFPMTRYMAVLDRPQPALDPLGVHVGSWILNPSLSTQGFADDNIFGTQHDRQSDVGVRIQPSATLQSNWGRNWLAFNGTAQIDRYARHSSENVENFDLSTQGRYDISHATVLRGGIRFIDSHLSRQSVDLFAQPDRPVHYSRLSAAIGATQDFGRLRLSSDFTYIHTNYRNGVLPDGSVYLQDTNDSDIYRPSIKLSYAPTPSIALFVQGLGDWRRFKLGTPTTPRRDSQGYQILGGVEFEPAALMRGSIGVGYIRQDFRDGRYRPVSGVALNANVQFFPTQLTTVTVHTDRQILDSGIPGSGGYLATTARIGVDHELLRQLILAAAAAYERDKFNNIDRVDGRFSTAASATYRMNRIVSLQARYEHVQLKSDGLDAFRNFVDNRLTLGLTLRR